MSYPTLDNFGVPTSGITTPDRGGILQPKYKYRYRVFVFRFGPPSPTSNMDLTQQVITCSRPNLQYNIVTVHAYNSVAYFAAKHEWQTISLKVRDDVTNSVSRLISWQLQKQLDHFQQTGFEAGVNYKFDLQLDIMDGSNDGVLETWYLEGCFLSDINWGEFDYAASEAADITMTIRYDNATQAGGIMPTPVQPTATGDRMT